MAQKLFRGRADALEDGIRGRVAVAAVDELEPVNAEQHDPEAAGWIFREQGFEPGQELGTAGQLAGRRERKGRFSAHAHR